MDSDCIEKLVRQFPATVAKMDNQFTSHDFLLKLSQGNQVDYIEALHICSSKGHLTPFKTVHGLLMKKLLEHTDLVRCVNKDCKDEDIFGDKVRNALWEKVEDR